MNRRPKVAIVTGGSEGIGAACVRLFLARGWKVAIVALPGPELDRMAAANPEVLAIPGDITAEGVRRSVIEETLSRFQRIDVLLNNAAVGLYASPSSVPIDLVRRLFDVNVFAGLALAQLAIPAMLRQRSGTIVNIGSVGGYVSLPWAVAYCASKFAVHAVDDSLYRELKPRGIHVMKVCPGIVDTKFRDHVLYGQVPDSVGKIRRVVSPDQVAKAILRGIEAGSRTVYVPWIGRIFTALGILAPRIMDWYLARKGQTVGDQPVQPGNDDRYRISHHDAISGGRGKGFAPSGMHNNPFEGQSLFSPVADSEAGV